MISVTVAAVIGFGMLALVGVLMGASMIAWELDLRRSERMAPPPHARWRTTAPVDDAVWADLVARLK